MLERQISGFEGSIKESAASVEAVSEKVAAKHDELKSARVDVSSGATESKAIVRRQLQIEVLVEKLEALSETSSEMTSLLVVIAERLSQNQLARKSLPKQHYSEDDEARIAIFEKVFRSNAGSFGYESAPIKEIEINRETLVPYLAHLELREIIKKAAPRTDLKADSSASDFVRLIWSYLLALFQTSSLGAVRGNHPGVLLFDEPGQHSMAEDSQHALLRQLASESQLQSIVAASFDESESVFRRATRDVAFELIRWDGQLIRPLRESAIL
jgi:hypothetical protein